MVNLNDVSIYFGGTNNIGNRRYLLKDSNVYLADDIHYAFISQGLTGLLDNRLLPFQLDLNRLQFSDFTLTRKDTGWDIDGTGSSNDKSRQSITKLINNWRQKEASDIQPYNKAEAPLHKITAGLEDGSDIEFFVLAIQPEIIIARPDLKIQYNYTKNEYYSLFSRGRPQE